MTSFRSGDNGLDNWLVGSLVVWLVRWLVGWLAAWFVGWTGTYYVANFLYVSLLSRLAV